VDEYAAAASRGPGGGWGRGAEEAGAGEVTRVMWR
jgi:hypothetical protein